MKTWLDIHLKTIFDQRLKEKNLRIQVLLGPRQVGKTSFIEQYINKSKKFLLVYGDGIHDSYWIKEQWDRAIENNQTLIIDEVQKIPNWSEVVKMCWDQQRTKKNKINCILLGSSSLNLEKGLSESLTGRFEIIRAFHWSYEQTQHLHKMAFDKYLIYGGYPGAYLYIEDTNRWEQYLRSSIIETVITKDILLQAKVKSPGLFRQCFYVLANLPGQVMSYNKILGQLQDKGNIDLVKYYIDLFEGAYLIRTIQKFGNNEIKKRQSSPKIIALSPAINTFHRMRNLDNEYMGRVFESLVGAQLLKHKHDIYYWAEGDFEVDFVFKHKNEIHAIEVKSGRNKKSNSIGKFIERYPTAKVIFINKDNYSKFEKDPLGFIENK